MTQAQIAKAIRAEEARAGNLHLWMQSRLSKGWRALKLERQRKQPMRGCDKEGRRK